MVRVSITKGMSMLLVDLLMAMIVIGIGTGVVIYSINLTKEYRRVVTQNNDLITKNCLELSAALIRVGNYTYLLINNYGKSNCLCVVANSKAIITTLTVPSVNTTVLKLGSLENYSELMIICNSTKVIKPVIIG